MTASRGTRVKISDVLGDKDQSESVNRELLDRGMEEYWKVGEL